MLQSKPVKHRSTTLVSKGIATKSVLVAAAVMMTIAAPLSISQRASADQFDDQIRAIQGQINQYQSQVNQLDAQANTLQAELDKITIEKNQIQAQVDLTQAQYDQLQSQIADTQKKIQSNKDALGDTIANMYVDNSVTPLEMLASSKNITDYVDQQEYRASIRDTLSATIDQIKQLQTKLKQDQAKVAVVLDQQKNQRAALAAKEDEQARLVEQTRGEEAAYQQLVNNAQAQAESAAAQQRAYYAAMRAQSGGSFDSGVVGSFVYANWSGNSGCGSDGYPYCGPQDSFADPWKLYNRECVSYAAWRIDQGYHRTVQPFQGDGMAYEWGQGSARGAWRVSDPQPGDAVVLPAMPGFAPVGHLMVVESVSGDWVHVSQYNFFGTGEYSTMDIKKSGVIFLRFPSK